MLFIKKKKIPHHVFSSFSPVELPASASASGGVLLLLLLLLLPQTATRDLPCYQNCSDKGGKTSICLHLWHGYHNRSVLIQGNIPPRKCINLHPILIRYYRPSRSPSYAMPTRNVRSNDRLSISVGQLRIALGLRHWRCEFLVVSH